MRNLKNQRLEVGLVLLIAIVSALLLFSGWQTLRDHRYYLEAEKQIVAINEELRALNLTISAFQDAEIGQRGYLLTQDPEYLEPYRNSLNAIETSLAWLQQIGDTSEYAHFLEEAAKLRTQKFAELEETLRMNDQFGQDVAIALVKGGHGKEMMDRVRKLSGDMIQAKRTQLADIKLVSQRRARSAELSTYLFGGAIATFMLLAYAYLVHDLRERSRLRARAEFAESRDALTGLYNRAFFRDLLANHLKHAYREGTRSAVIFVNLNNFRDINNAYGYAAGNQVLIEAGHRLEDTARKGEPVARLRDDEFALLVPRVDSIGELSIFAGRLLDALTPSLIPGMPEKYLGVSIGIAVYPEDGTSAGELLRSANQAVRIARKEGRSRYRFFSGGVHAAPSRADILTSGLHRAVERQEFSLLFQPQVDLATQRIVGAEALVRWSHPEHGPVSPDEFIPIAEKTGLLLPLGVWVLHEACRQAQRWNRQGAALSIAVNVSAAELVGEDFVQVITDALSSSGLPAHLLEIEITERALMNERAAKELQRIKQLGVRISMDDFGTGYSSLSYLTRLSLDALKIDKSFIQHIPGNWKDCGVARTIINIGKELGIKVIAEGVETGEQAQFLRAHGCDLGQGYLYYRPMSAAAMEDLVRTVPA